MYSEAKELWAFIKALEAEPNDTETRKVFADWLEEHDEPEEADRQRQMTTVEYQERKEAEEWLRQFCGKYGADYDELLEACSSQGGYCFGDDDGPYATRKSSFWDNIEIVLNRSFDEDHRENTPFRCAC